MKHIYNGCFLIVLCILFSCSEKKANNEQVNLGANDLIKESSPYLLQHAYNPVHWKAWNPETLKQAKDENRLMVISVGYSACHWCHVMEEESFENDSVAKLMNANFINIKVDREERPDVDKVYMNAVQLMTGSGGWPLNCITLPDGRPVFGGTYFTKKQWTKILKDISNLYKNNPDKIIEYADNLTQGLKTYDLITINKEEVKFNKNNLKSIVDKLEQTLDFKKGGQKKAPKFPMPSNLDFLLRYSHQSNDDKLRAYVLTSLEKMGNGGIYDQIGGGFSRYSVDDKWHVPHFEKMLYDNAQLVSLYSKAYQITKKKEFKTIIEETLEFVDRELTDGTGAFYTSLDADSKDSEGELKEGAYYTWTAQELKQLLGSDFEMFKTYYNVNAIGKWEEDRYILFKTKTNIAFSETNNITPTDLDLKLKDWKSKLIKERAKRKPPRTDDKVLTSCNALMLSAYVDAYQVLGNKEYLQKAIKNATFIRDNQIKKDKSMYHTYKNGTSSIQGFSEDYAHTISAFINLYEVTLNQQWLDLAKELMDYTLLHFLNKENSMFYFTSDTTEDLIARRTEVADNVIPSSNSVLAENAFKLGHYYSDKKYTNLANQMLSNVNANISTSPSGYTNWMSLYLNYAYPYYEVAISGSDADKKLQQLHTAYIPNILIAGSKINSNLPLLKNKYIEEETFIYVCTNGSCKMPVNDAEKAKQQILK